MDLNSVPKLKRRYLKLRSGIILIFPNYLVNEVGSRCIMLSDGSRTIKQIIEIICAEYDIPNREVVEREVLPFFNELEKLGLVVDARSN